MKRTRALLLALLLSGGLVAVGAWLWSSEAVERWRLRRLSVAELDDLAVARNADPLVLAALAGKLNRERRHGRAATVARAGLLLDPKSPELYAELGLALARSSQVLAAIAQLEEAARLQYKGREALYELAQCYGQAYQDQKQVAVLEGLVSRYPEDSRYRRSLSTVYLHRGQLAEAEDQLQEAIRADPQGMDSRLLLGRALAEKADSPERFSRAERELNTVLEAQPRRLEAHVALGILRYRAGDFRRAVESLERAAHLGKVEEHALFFLGQSYLRMGRSQEARAMLARYQKFSDESREITQLENRVLNRPDGIEARLRLVRLYHVTGQRDQALQHLEQILQRQPSCEEALRIESALKRERE